MKPHGQNLGPLINRHLRVPEIYTKPAVAPPLSKELDVLSHLQPYKMEKIEKLEVPECIQPKVKRLFMDSLEYMGATKSKRTADRKPRKEVNVLENMKAKVKHDAVNKKIDMLIEEDLHPYVFGCRMRGAMNYNEKFSTMMFRPNKNLLQYFNNPQKKFLWKQKRFETEDDQEMKRERMKNMTALIRDQNRKDAEKFRIMQDMERGRRYLGNNILNRKMRIGRMKSTVKRLKVLENQMAKITGMDEEAQDKIKTLKEKIDKLQDIAIHDFTIEHKKAVGDNFWKPLFGKEEDELPED